MDAWDPIGVRDVPEAQDEYDTCVSGVFSRLVRRVERHYLELHSNKSRNVDVIQQLGQALERLQGREPEAWEHEEQKLEDLRQTLNRYPQAMHWPQPTGESIFQGLSKPIGLCGATEIQLSWPAPDAVDRDKLESQREWVEKLATARPTGMPWNSSPHGPAHFAS